MIPKHRIYTEAFCGGAAVFWMKEPSTVEIINDTNFQAINFYRVLKTKFPALKKELIAICHSRELHRRSLIVLQELELFPDPVVRAAAFFVATQQGFANMIGKGWGYDRDGTTSKRISRKIKMITDEYAKRLDHVQIECYDAIKIINSRDAKDAFHFCDPPYFNSNCGHYNGYSEEDFKQLLETLQSIEGKFLLTCYDSPIAKDFIKKNGWEYTRVEARVSVTYRTKKKKIELLIRNYELPP